MKTLPSVSQWLDHFAACVRNRDLRQGRKLFDPKVRAFGTRAEQAGDLADLEEHQWRRVWFNTRGFRFLHETVTQLISDDGSLICVLALWDSEGLNPDDQTFVRRGRCTIALRREASSPLGYVAIHTHFSKNAAGRTLMVQVGRCSKSGTPRLANPPGRGNRKIAGNQNE